MSVRAPSARDREARVVHAERDLVDDLFADVLGTALAVAAMVHLKLTTAAEDAGEDLDIRDYPNAVRAKIDLLKLTGDVVDARRLRTRASAARYAAWCSEDDDVPSLSDVEVYATIRSRSVGDRPAKQDRKRRAA